MGVVVVGVMGVGEEVVMGAAGTVVEGEIAAMVEVESVLGRWEAREVQEVRWGLCWVPRLIRWTPWP